MNNKRLKKIDYHNQFSEFVSSLDSDYKKTSLSLINEGSSSLFIKYLINEVNDHRALNHPYLLKLSKGLLPNIDEAIKDYANQYSYYSSWFVRYLKGVINSLPSDKLKSKFMENIIEEEGNPHASELKDKPHVEIFNHFKNLIGVDEKYISNNPASTTSLIWRNLFLQKCDSEFLGIGLGAIGLATEYIVPKIYKYILEAIDNHSSFDPGSSLFFRLHIDCDEGHAENLIAITKEIAEDIRTRESIRFGVLSALNLRNAFWDSQYSRAMNMKRF